MTVEVSKRTFNVAEYNQMVKAGILTENDQVELINGEIIAMSPVGSRHASCVKRLNILLGKQLKENFILSVQDPIQLDDYSEPEPDLAVLKPRPDFYAEAHPRPDDVLMIIEVSDTTLDYDQEIKIPLYAKAGIPEVWIINLQENTVEIYTTPQTGLYRKVEFFKSDDRLVSSVFSELKVAANQVLV
jgi:Uma2 family endonuclease